MLNKDHTHWHLTASIERFDGSFSTKWSACLPGGLTSFGSLDRHVSNQDFIGTVRNGTVEVTLFENSVKWRIFWAYVHVGITWPRLCVSLEKLHGLSFMVRAFASVQLLPCSEWKLFYCLSKDRKAFVVACLVLYIHKCQLISLKMPIDIKEVLIWFSATADILYVSSSNVISKMPVL